MSHFVIPYAGNKRNEYKSIKDFIKFDGIQNIIEPFCGTSAISFNIWLEYGDKFNYYLNDNSADINLIYNLIKNEEPDNVLLKMNELKHIIKGKEDFLNLFSKYKNDVIKDPIDLIVLTKLSSQSRIGMYGGDNRKPKADYKYTNLQRQFYEFIKSPNVFFSNNEWINIYDKFKDDEETIIIFDPPYLSLCNDFYQNKSVDIYEYVFYNPIKNNKANIYFILENMWIIKLLFKDCNYLTEYEKRYEISKKHTKHVLIYNKSGN
jgi:hypothetical protein